MKQLFLKPGAVADKALPRCKTSTLVVRDPITGRALDADGEYKQPTTYWLRRLRCGDVVQTRPQAAAKGAAQQLAKKDGDK